MDAGRRAEASTLPTARGLLPRSSVMTPGSPPDLRPQPDGLLFFLNLFLEKKKNFFFLLGRDEWSPKSFISFLSQVQPHESWLSISAASLFSERSEVLR